MKKAKIAISLDQPLLDIVDGKVDGYVMRSRSQVIEHYLMNSLQDELLTTGVIFIKGDHQKYLLRDLKGKSLLNHHFDLFESTGITKVIIITQQSPNIRNLHEIIAKSKLNVKIVVKNVKGTGEALFFVKDFIDKEDFVAMSGDIYNNFNLRMMIEKHISHKKVCTLGLMSKQNTEQSGTVLLDGDLVIDFEEKSSHPKSNIVNAGIYVFSPIVFEYIDKSTVSLENDVFSKLAEHGHLVGFFTHGEYIHMEDNS